MPLLDSLLVFLFVAIFVKTFCTDSYQFLAKFIDCFCLGLLCFLDCLYL